MRHLLLAAILCACLPAARAVGSEEVLAVIVPQGFVDKTISAQELGLIFKRKKLFWDDGSRIQPVNLPSDDPLRRQFSLRVMKTLPESQSQYWNSMYYHGVFPPHVVGSSEAMLRYVAETRGAIGYVEACRTDSRVKPLLWILPAGGVTQTPPALDCPAD